MVLIPESMFASVEQSMRVEGYKMSREALQQSVDDAADHDTDPCPPPRDTQPMTPWPIAADDGSDPDAPIGLVPASEPIDKVLDLAEAILSLSNRELSLLQEILNAASEPVKARAGEVAEPGWPASLPTDGV